MNIFQKSKQAVSQICICLVYKIKLNGKDIEQIQYLTENYIYTEAMGKKLIYLPENDKQFIIDTEKKQLKELDLSAQMMQMNQIKAMIGELNRVEKEENGKRHIVLQNSAESPVKLTVNIQTQKLHGLEKTVFGQYNEFQQNMQMFRIKLDNNEIAQLTESVLFVNGQEQKSSVELVDIKNNSETIDRMDSYCNYKITK